MAAMTSSANALSPSFQRLKTIATLVNYTSRVLLN